MNNKHIHIQERIKQLDNIADSLKAINTNTASSMLHRATELRNAYATFETQLSHVITTTKFFLTTLTEMSAELEERMPRFWLWHYLYKDGEFLTHIDVWSQKDFYVQAWSLAKLTLLRELPSTWHAWSLLLTHLTFLIVPFIILGFLAHTFIDRILSPYDAQNNAQNTHLNSSMDYLRHMLANHLMARGQQISNHARLRYVLPLLWANSLGVDVTLP